MAIALIHENKMSCGLSIYQLIPLRFEEDSVQADEGLLWFGESAEHSHQASTYLGRTDELPMDHAQRKF